mmetsp:Transcript_17677/g.45455  ORF Transcript_17677/g.45455 Transcript_17677/m.45455 type:complete len:243 (-) Transcript_17677:839-1567(-)
MSRSAEVLTRSWFLGSSKVSYRSLSSRMDACSCSSPHRRKTSVSVPFAPWMYGSFTSSGLRTGTVLVQTMAMLPRPVRNAAARSRCSAASSSSSAAFAARTARSVPSTQSPGLITAALSQDRSASSPDPAAKAASMPRGSESSGVRGGSRGMKIRQKWWKRRPSSSLYFIPLASSTMARSNPSVTTKPQCHMPCLNRGIGSRRHFEQPCTTPSSSQLLHFRGFSQRARNRSTSLKAPAPQSV